MTPIEVVRDRLRSQRLAGSPLGRPEDVVEWSGAVQSQDYSGAKWSLAQRLSGATDASIDAAFDEGRILRTHVMRPTWHFVAPADIRWLQRLTAPRLHARNADVNRRMEIDDALAARSQELFRKVMGGGVHLTRNELAVLLDEIGIRARGPRLAFIMMRAEVDLVVCSGPRRGLQHTYALLDERTPAGLQLEGDEALAALADRYFRSHGPATIRDFCWWSGLLASAARRAVALAGPEIEEVVVGADRYLRVRSRREGDGPKGAHLLPEFDEATVAYRELRVVARPGPQPPGFRSNSLDRPVLVDGHMIGTWSRPAAGAIQLSLFRPPSPSDTVAVEEATERLARFLGARLEVRIELASRRGRPGPAG